MKRICLVTSALPLFAGWLTTTVCPAQAPLVVPNIFRGTFAPTAHSTPLGRTKYFGQHWYRGDSLPAVFPIRYLGYRTPRGATYSARNIVIGIVLDNSRIAVGGLSKTFTANLSSSPTTFFKLKQLSLPAVTNNQTPDQPNPWIAGDAVMVYLGPNLLVQTDVQTSTTPSTTGYLCDGFSAGGNVFTTGTSCGKSRLVWQQSGSSHSLAVTGAPASAPVVFHVGIDNRSFGGAPLPLDLGALGMTNCSLMLNPLVTAILTADSSGRASLTGTLTPPSPAVMVFVQASHPEAAANPANYVATNMASSILGTNGLGDYVYNWTTFGTTAQYGPYYPTMYGQILLLK